MVISVVVFYLRTVRYYLVGAYGGEFMGRFQRVTVPEEAGRTQVKFRAVAPVPEGEFEVSVCIPPAQRSPRWSRFDLAIEAAEWPMVLLRGDRYRANDPPVFHLPTANDHVVATGTRLPGDRELQVPLDIQEGETTRLTLVFGAQE
ncbi:MAG: hypothetical protein ACI841_000995 [Planctomycetota bacterium]